MSERKNVNNTIDIGYNPITNPIPNVNQNPYIEKQRLGALSANRSLFGSLGTNIVA
jgi:hypothetical protein